MGETAVAAFLADMKQQKISMVSQGKDVQYLREPVATIHPLMKDAKHYPNIKVYVVQSSDCEAR